MKKLLELFVDNLLAGTTHTSIGQEADAVGVLDALDREKDMIWPITDAMAISLHIVGKPIVCSPKFWDAKLARAAGEAAVNICIGVIFILLAYRVVLWRQPSERLWQKKTMVQSAVCLWEMAQWAKGPFTRP